MPDYKKGYQEDAQEFMQSFLNALNNACFYHPKPENKFVTEN